MQVSNSVLLRKIKNGEIVWAPVYFELFLLPKNCEDNWTFFGWICSLKKFRDWPCFWIFSPQNVLFLFQQTASESNSCNNYILVGKYNWANGISELSRSQKSQPHCRLSAKQNLKQIPDSVVLTNNGASCTSYSPATHVPNDSWVPHSPKGLFTFSNYKSTSTQSLTKRNGYDKQSVIDSALSDGGGQVSLLAALNGNQGVKSIIPPVPPVGSKKPAVMDEQSMLAAELHQLEVCTWAKYINLIA